MKWRREHHGQSRSARRAAERQEAAIAAFGEVLPRAASLTLYMCWHQGLGHDYPREVMQAAQRLRGRYAASSLSDDTYTILKFAPSDGDLRDVMVVVPYCDDAYATDAEGTVLAEVPGD